MSNAPSQIPANPPDKPNSLIWFRRDLRLADHPARHAAIGAASAAGGNVLMAFVLDPALWNSSGRPRRSFLRNALADLDERTGGSLTILRGDPEQVLPAVTRHASVGSIHVSADFTPYGRRRDKQMEKTLSAMDVAWVPTGSPYAVSPGRIRKSDGSAYRVFTPFANAWLRHGWPRPPAPPRARNWMAYEGPHRTELPPPEDLSGTSLPGASEVAAQQAWARFRDGPLTDYRTARDRPDLSGTSRMSAYLRFGLLHPRTLLADVAGRTDAGTTTYRNELCWREFYADVLYVNPDSAWHSVNPRFETFRWDTGHDAEQAFARWQRGDTGYPIVDAGMRQLLREGWMHNRVRMITASFLVKDLHLPWQRGARHFLDHLVDGDLASNNHGWQWTAGTGMDAAPYFRVFNPVRQGKKFDPTGDYVRRYVPELRSTAGTAVHEPWLLPSHPDGYPQRVVDHDEERAEALRRYEEIR